MTNFAKKNITTLAIETSCDDTSIAIVRFDGTMYTVDKMLAASSIDDHQKYGWVVPEIASRRHSEDIIPLLEQFTEQEKQNVDCISVTTQPGLPGSLMVGKATASMLAHHYNKPLHKIHHIHGHIFSFLLERKREDIQFPCVVLTASGWHNDLYAVYQTANYTPPSDDINNEKTISDNTTVWPYTIVSIGKTLDDASGEAFDKVARMLWWPYPGGPRISKQAQLHTPNPDKESDYRFSRVFLSKDNRWNFSFSWTKGQARRIIDNYTKNNPNAAIPSHVVSEIAHEFQESTIEVLAKKLCKAALHLQAKTVAIVWWVSANKRLREYAQELIEHPKYKHLQLYKPTTIQYSTDNAAMIWLIWLLEKESDMNSQC